MQALDSVRPYMESHGGNVELLGVEDGVARLRLEGSCKSCRASSSTLELAVRQALEAAAPDLEGMDVEGVLEEEDDPGIGGTPLPVIQVNGDNGWRTLEIDPPESVAATAVDGVPLFVANVNGTLLAYRNSCPDCGGALDGGALEGGALSCPGAGTSSRCRRRAARSTATGSSSSRSRCCASGKRSRSPCEGDRRGRRGPAQGADGLRPARAGQAEGDAAARNRRPPTRSAATCAGRRSRPTTATCSTSTSARSSACARGAGG